MKKTIIIQGRDITQKDIEMVSKIINDSPSLNRSQLAKELARIWNWRTINGSLKNMAAYSFLLKLEKQGQIVLPPRKRPPVSAKRNSSVPLVLHSSQPIITKLKTISPIKVIAVEDDIELSLFKCLLSTYHYLGFSGAVGENLKYMAYDAGDRPLACLLFGAAAWSCAPRDFFIGWDSKTRAKNLALVANNMRFLILPWVEVAHLASHILARVSRRVSDDWRHKYGHHIHLLETFVEYGRFKGTCYKAANWHFVGKTKGRSRNDVYNTLKVPIKDIYLYPLTKGFRKALSEA